MILKKKEKKKEKKRNHSTALLETLESVVTFVAIKNLYIYNHFSKFKEKCAISFYLLKKNHVLFSWPEEINYDILYFSINKEYKYM